MEANQMRSAAPSAPPSQGAPPSPAPFDNRRAPNSVAALVIDRPLDLQAPKDEPMLTTETHTKLIECSDAHCAADEFIAGHYDWHGGACAIGCAVRDCQKMGILDASLDPSDHAALASATGLPKMVLLLQDHVFEGLSDEERPHWPPRFWRPLPRPRDGCLHGKDSGREV